MKTPLRQDTRFFITAGVSACVLALAAFRREPSEQVLTFLGLLLGGFLAQSQWGQTKRATSTASEGKPPAP